MITMKLKKDGKFQVIDMPPKESLTAAILLTWSGKPCVLEFVDGERKMYAYGDESVRGKWEVGKCTMDMESFAHYWRYKLLEYGIDLFTRQENAAERRAICEVENVPPEEIAKILESQPHLYEATP